MVRSRLIFHLLFTAVAGWAQPPAIFPHGVVNAASQMPPALPGGAIARGSRVLIRGIRLAGPVTFGGEAAHVISMSDRLIEAIAPTAVALGDVLVTVGASEPLKVRMVAASPGIYGDVQKLADGRYRMRVTGLGDGKPEVIAGRAIATIVRVAPSEPGVSEVTFEVLRAAPNTPVQIKVGAVVSNTVLLPPVVRPADWVMPDLSGKSRSGFVLLTRIDFRFDGIGGARGEITDDEGVAAFVATDRQQLSPMELPTAPGTCAAYTRYYYPNDQTRSLAAKLVRGLAGMTNLDAGEALRIEGGPTAGKLRRYPNSGVYGAALGGESPEYGLRPLPPFFGGTLYHVAGDGGADVGPFRLAIPNENRLSWTNRNRVDVVDRRAGVTLRWRSRPGHRILILALNTNEATGALGIAFCHAASGSSSFQIPPNALANLPPTESGALPTSMLMLMSVPEVPATAGVKGLDRLTGYFIQASGRTVVFR